MKETLHNGYLKIRPLVHDSFVSVDKGNYEELGTVLSVDETVTSIPIGAVVRFDSFMAKKYPVQGKEGEYDWYIHYSEVVSHAIE